MNNIKLYVIRDAKYPQWYFQRIEDYSSMMGYLAKNHPQYTLKFTNDIKKAMHFGTPNEVLEFIKEHAIEGTIVKDPYSVAAHIRDRIVENLVNLEKAVKAIG